MSSCRAPRVEIYPLATKEFEASGGSCPAAPGPPEEAGGLAGINGSTALGGESVTTPVRVWLCRLTFVDWFASPFMTDALVLLLGVTPAFGTVSPTSCKDGSRYMATSDGDGEEVKGDVTWLGLLHKPPLEAQSFSRKSSNPI